MNWRAIKQHGRWYVAWGSGSSAHFNLRGRITNDQYHSDLDRQLRASALSTLNKAAELARDELGPPPFGNQRSARRKAFCEAVAAHAAALGTLE